jgi:hypothetical protein
MSTAADPVLGEAGLRIYLTLPAGPHPRELAAALHDAGWSSRKSAWDEYEVGQTWAELNLFVQDGKSMVSGCVLPTHVDGLLSALERLATAYEGELYDRSGALLRTFP